MTLNAPQTEEPTDRREAIAAAFDAQEAEHASTSENTAPREEPKAEAEAGTPAEATETRSQAAEPAEEGVSAKQVDPTETPRTERGIERAPQSWKPAEKAKWAEIDPGVRQEVLRREAQINQVLAETAPARNFVGEFQQLVQPYAARIQAMGVSPMQAVGELFKADYILSSAPAPQRAAFMAKLISDYGVDIQQLDAVLSGQSAQVDPVQARIDQQLQQQLAPLNEFIQLQKQQAEALEQQKQQAVQQEIYEMSQNTKDFPYFNQVRESMADWIEISQKKNQHIDLKTAYNKAVMSDPELSRLVLLQNQTALQAAQAQRAKQASVSVRGAPNAMPIGSPPATDRRAIIAQAFDTLGSR